MDDMWSNSLMIEKVGDPTISQFNIPDYWTPPHENIKQTKFEDVENPGNVPPYFYCPLFKKNDYLWHKLPTRAMHVQVDDHGWICSNNWEFL